MLDPGQSAVHADPRDARRHRNWSVPPIHFNRIAQRGQDYLLRQPPVLLFFWHPGIRITCWNVTFICIDDLTGRQHLEPLPGCLIQSFMECFLLRPKLGYCAVQGRLHQGTLLGTELEVLAEPFQTLLRIIGCSP
ncbi:hypothetical protein [Streptomyces sp. NPDC093589]|uniref:hypothetical protein n=1 Tax=Streptomyces sp. NPDC093589 TaxID=3366043 RepID=UPI0037FBF4F4